MKRPIIVSASMKKVGMRVASAKLTILVAALAMVAASRASEAAVYDVATDYSITANPNGVWSYGFISSGNLNMSNFVLVQRELEESLGRVSE